MHLNNDINYSDENAVTEEMVLAFLNDPTQWPESDLGRYEELATRLLGVPCFVLMWPPETAGELPSEQEARLCAVVCDRTAGMDAKTWTGLLIAERIGWMLQAVNDPPATEATSETEPVDARRIQVDLAQMTICLDGETFSDVQSPHALRWIKVLAEQPGVWISSKELLNYDSELDGCRTDKLRRHLPPQILKLISSKNGKGSRLLFGRK